MIFRPCFDSLVNKKEIVIAEIGVEKGRNSENILRCLDVKTIYLIDPYLNSDSSAHKRQARNRMSKFVGVDIIWLTMKSSDADKYIDDESLDCVYIDGDHSYDSVITDIVLYKPKVKIGGIISGDDIHQEPVKKAVESIFGRGYKSFKNRDNGYGGWFIVKNTGV